MTEELKPCPFWGHSELSVQKSSRGLYKDNTIFRVYCWDCGAEGPPGKTEQEAADLWNTRTADALESRLPAEG